jgi:hypothetical protein
VWCAVKCWVNHWSSVHHETVNLDQYITNTLEPFFEQLTDDERQYGCFLQASATANTAWNSVSAIQELFDDRFINTGLWPPELPDLVSVTFICG